jgi:hypothetical protein
MRVRTATDTYRIRFGWNVQRGSKLAGELFSAALPKCYVRVNTAMNPLAPGICARIYPCAPSEKKTFPRPDESARSKPITED